jgi:hypothetical protein
MTTVPADRAAAERVLAAVVERFVQGPTVGTAGPVLRGPGEWAWPDGTPAADYDILWEAEGAPDLWPFDETVRAAAGDGVLLAPVAGRSLAVMLRL